MKKQFSYQAFHSKYSTISDHNIVCILFCSTVYVKLEFNVNYRCTKDDSLTGIQNSKITMRMLFKYVL